MPGDDDDDDELELEPEPDAPSSPGPGDPTPGTSELSGGPSVDEGLGGGCVPSAPFTRSPPHPPLGMARAKAAAARNAVL
jgi:hypothetical protein